MDNKTNLNLYVIYLSAETCCDYWSMSVAVVSETYEKAKEIAVQRFINRFHETPSRSNSWEVYSVPLTDLTEGFNRIVDSYSGTK